MTFLDQLNSVLVLLGAIIVIVSAVVVFLVVYIGGDKRKPEGRDLYPCRDCWNCDGATWQTDKFCPHCGAVNPWGSHHQRGLTDPVVSSSAHPSTQKPSPNK